MKKFKKQLFSVVTTIAIVLAQTGTVVWADGNQPIYDINKESVVINDSCGESCGGHLITGTGEKTGNTISVIGGKHNITIKGVNIDVGTTPFSIGDSNVTLILKETNILISPMMGCAILVNKEASIVIMGEGSLKASGALGGMVFESDATKCGSITINSGNVIATGVTGIGSKDMLGSGGNITINGGNVTAVGSVGYGIGGADCDITISKDAKVKASGGGRNPAIYDKDGDIGPANGTTATILMANFSNQIPQGTITQIKQGVTVFNNFTPSRGYKSIAMTVPSSGTYKVVTGGINQQHTTSPNPKNANFIVNKEGLNTFESVEKSISVGEVSISTKIGEGAPKVSIFNSEALIKKVKDEDKTDIESGKDVDLILDVIYDEGMNNHLKNNMEKDLDGNEFGLGFGIKYEKRIGAILGEPSLDNYNSTTVQIEVPESLKPESGTTRTFAIYGVEESNDKSTLLKESDPNSNVITMNLVSYGAYIISYKDSKGGSTTGSGNTTSGTTSSGTTNNFSETEKIIEVIKAPVAVKKVVAKAVLKAKVTAVPKTGDPVEVDLLLTSSFALAMLSLGLYLISRKKLKD